MGQFIVLGLVGFFMFAMWACCKVSGDCDSFNHKDSFSVDEWTDDWEEK